MILDDESGLGTCFRGIDHKDAMKFAEEYGDITNRIGENFIEFNITIEGEKIAVSLNKEPFNTMRYAIFNASTDLNTIYQP